MTKIQYASDLHLEFAENSHYLKKNPIKPMGDILVLAGDIGYLGSDAFIAHPFWDWAADNYEQVIVCLGNHEFYRYYDLASLADGTDVAIRPNVHYFYNKVVPVGDINMIVSTLWSHIDQQDAFMTERCVSDFHRIIYKDEMLDWQHFNQEHDRCLQFIKHAVAASQAKKKIVVTHHVPSVQLMSPEFAGSPINGAFTTELAGYIKRSDINYWIYGHSHRNINRLIGNTQCVCNQLGYVSHNEHLDFKDDAVIEL